jgi:hypothetical protein
MGGEAIHHEEPNQIHSWITDLGIQM